MPASRANYVVLFESESQVYATANKERALEHAPPIGSTLEQKHILFITYQPDNQILSVHPLPREEIETAEIKIVTRKKKGDAEEA